MESSSATLRLPRRVRSAAQAAIGGRRLDGELAWMSWMGTVWRLAGESGAVYVKRAADLAGERDRLKWLHGRLPVPELVGFFHAAGDDWLMTRELAGVPLYHASVGWTVARRAVRCPSPASSTTRRWSGKGESDRPQPAVGAGSADRAAYGRAPSLCARRSRPRARRPAVGAGR